MHVVTMPQDETFSYTGSLPRDAQEYTEMYQRALGQGIVVSGEQWDAFLAEHNSEYAG